MASPGIKMQANGRAHSIQDGSLAIPSKEHSAVEAALRRARLPICVGSKSQNVFFPRGPNKPVSRKCGQNDSVKDQSLKHVCFPRTYRVDLRVMRVCRTLRVQVRKVTQHGATVSSTDDEDLHGTGWCNWVGERSILTPRSFNVIP